MCFRNPETKWIGMERETSIFKVAKNDSDVLVRSKNVSGIKSSIVGSLCIKVSYVSTGPLSKCVLQMS